MLTSSSVRTEIDRENTFVRNDVLVQSNMSDDIFIRGDIYLGSDNNKLKYLRDVTPSPLGK